MTQPAGFEAVLMVLSEDNDEGRRHTEPDSTPALHGPILDDTDPELIAALSELFDEYGPLGVANTARKMQAGLNPDADPDDPDPESAGSILARLGTDGALWAAEMADVYPVLDGSPGSLLHNWLANAIEAGRSAGYQAGLQAAEDSSDRRVRMFMTEPPD
jgi:hypothetical protein